MKNSSQHTQREKRVRKKMKSDAKTPRLSVYRSNKFVYAQIIDDQSGKTIVGVTEKHIGKDTKGNKIDRAKELGLLIAKKARDKKIVSVIFDRGGYAYHGKVKAIAEGAREGGLKF